MTETAQPHDLSVDQQHALLTAARLLADEFSGVYGQETIERFLYSSYDQFAGSASIPNYLPLFAERFARQRLRALARVEGKRNAWLGMADGRRRRRRWSRGGWGDHADHERLEPCDDECCCGRPDGDRDRRCPR